jgi:MYXO-CTERM domain-containing protein
MTQRALSLRLGVCLAPLVLCWSVSASAATAKLAWDANTEPDVIGYKLYYDTDSGPPYTGTQAHEGPAPVDVPVSSLSDPANPAYELTGLPSCVHFYFAVTAYNSSTESDFSGEVEATVVAAPTSITTSFPAPGSLEVKWDALPSDDSGTLSTWRIYYDTDSGEPYGGTGADQGASPIEIAPGSLSDPLHPSFTLTGLPAATTFYVAVESVCADTTTRLSDETTAVPGSAGAGGNAGSGGSAGNAGAGGAAGSGGTPQAGAGGAPGSGGAAAGSGGSAAGAAGSNSGQGGSPQEPGAAPVSQSDSGCSCSTPGAGRQAGLGVLWIAALAALRSRARRLD